jgi:hypothetical protein
MNANDLRRAIKRLRSIQSGADPYHEGYRVACTDLLAMLARIEYGEHSSDSTVEEEVRQ